MERAIRFLATITDRTADQLFSAIDSLLAQGTSKIRLLLSTPGGSVFHGLSIHNYLKGLPVEVDTYNFGSVDSIGVVIYLAGSRRYTVPHSRFLIHGVKYTFNFNGQLSLDEKQLEEYLKSLQIDQRNIAKVIAGTTGKTFEQVDADMNNRTTLNPDEAQEYGIVHEINTNLLLPAMQVITIGEPIQGQPYNQKQITVPNVQISTKPNVTSVTENISIHMTTL